MLVPGQNVGGDEVGRRDGRLDGGLEGGVERGGVEGSADRGGRLGFLERVFKNGVELRRPGGLGRWGVIAFGVILVLGVVVRFWGLDRVPPGLWYDEALYCLDGVKVSRGEFSIFFDEHGHPREPLFPWLLGLAFWLFEPTTLVARCVSAVWGSLAVALFLPVARRFLPDRWALGAMAAFAVFRWHIHFSRTIFRAGLASPLMLFTVWMFLRWLETRRRMDAALCGVGVGLCLYTYISLRLAPVLVVVWLLWLGWRSSADFWRRDGWRGAAWIFGVAGVLFLPLGVDYVRNPEHLSERTDEVSMFEDVVEVEGADGGVDLVRVRRGAGEVLRGLAGNAWGVAKVWFVEGDYVARHGIPYRPVFDPMTGLFFLVGLGVAVVGVVRWGALGGVMLLTWFGGFCMASVLSYGAPNILRMQGASPAVILLMMMGLWRATEAWPRGVASGVKRMMPGIVVVFFGATQVYEYFGVYPNDVRVREAFGADVFYGPGRGVDEVAARVGRVFVPVEFGESLQVRFLTVRRDNVVWYGPGDVVEVEDGVRVAWLETVRSRRLAEDAGNGGQLAGLEAGGVAVRREFMVPVAEEAGDGGVVWVPWAVLSVGEPGSMNER